MRQVGRVVLLATVFAVGLAAGRSVVPGVAFACSCAPPKALAEYAREPRLVVIAGDVRAIELDGRAPFIVRQVFHGFQLPERLLLETHEAGMCEPTIVPNQSVIFVGVREGDSVRPAACAPYAEVGSPEGRQLLAEAAATFGRGGSGVTSPGDPSGGALLPILGAIAALTIGLFGAVGLLARRRGQPT